MVNGSWTQTIAYMLKEYIEQSGDTNTNNILLIESLLEANRAAIISEMKKDPIKIVEVITKYINTETTKYVLVEKPEQVRPPSVKVIETRSNPSDPWQAIANGWQVKTDDYGRKYYRRGTDNKTIIREDQYNNQYKAPASNTYYNRW